MSSIIYITGEYTQDRTKFFWRHVVERTNIAVKKKKKNLISHSKESQNTGAGAQRSWGLKNSTCQGPDQPVLARLSLSGGQD